ncbi:hypothetical protein IAU60_004847 [Kwoniella sp. DSM 27419]
MWHSHLTPSQTQRFATVTRLAVPLLASLTILFILLPGISGPSTGLFWLRVKYAAGDSSDLGGLGACQADRACPSWQMAPPHWRGVHDLLVFHIAAAIIFFILACVASALFHFPDSPTTKRWGTLFPILNLLLPTIVMIADLCVPHGIETKEDVESVERVGVYWLGTAGFVFALTWCAVVELVGAQNRREAMIEQDEQRDLTKYDPAAQKGWAEKAGEAAWSMWPWRGDAPRSESLASRSDRRSKAEPRTSRRHRR